MLNVEYIFLVMLSIAVMTASAEQQFYVKQNTWVDSVIQSRRAMREYQASIKAGAGRLGTEQQAVPDMKKTAGDVWKSLCRDFPLESDWIMQETGYGSCADWLTGPTITAQKLTAFVAACTKRRNERLRPLRERWRFIVFTKHYNLGGSHYAYTEGQSDAQSERHFIPGSALCVLDTSAQFGAVHILTNDPRGVIRDPDVSYDGRSVLFSWKKSDREDDYHLYELDIKSRKISQITEGLGFADYEGVYLPDDTIVFNSTRCVQIVDCWWTEVSNIYTCDREGNYLRRLGFDQVHVNYPQVLPDGRVIYTRWDYNDRGQIYPQPLFQMNYDGTAQTEYYGNNSWFPTTIMHARGIQGSQKLIAVLSGHHSSQQGKLALIDSSKGRQEASGVQLVAPLSETKAVRIDGYGQWGELFQYPYALSETNYIVAFTANQEIPFGIYFMTIDGWRELLAFDPDISCNQPVPLAPRKRPLLRPGLVDYRNDSGIYYLQDIYEGQGLKGVTRGLIKKLRVVALEFRAAGIGSNGSGGPGGGALISTPVSIGNGCWDVKKVLGETPVYDDGSACFSVPARTPIYFQAIDDKGHVAQTMRSWSTLMPGERYACVGCHEHKNSAPPVSSTTQAMQTGVQPLEPFYGEARGFSFTREIQPILDARCVRCHDGAGENGIDLSKTEIIDEGARRKWFVSYLTLTGAPRTRETRGTSNGSYVKWISAQSVPEMLPPYSAGSARSPLTAILDKGHHEVQLTAEERDKLNCWIDLGVPFCGDYVEANCWNEAERKKYERYMAKRKAMEEQEQRNIQAYINARTQLARKSN